MKRHNASCAVLAAGVAFLVGCGDENNTTEITQVVGMQVVEAGESMPNCTVDNEGAMVYSVDSAEAFYCVSRKWVSMKGEKGEDGKKGADGKSGSAGADGKDGASCTAKALKDGKGYKIVCGGDSVGVVMSGAEGAQGVKGDSGVAGAAGLSAYEIAKAGGYAGTEEEWIASLKGDPGVKGDSGVAGAKGLSAYEIAKAGGYAGTEEEWIESLKGTPGAKGDSGVAGTSCSAEKDTGGVKITCTDGKTYTLSNGADGKDGRNFEKDWMVDHRDYHIYKIVTIGTQTWMAENLNYETATSSCYKDSAKYCEKYGRLYTWATAVGKSEDDCGYGNSCSLGTGKIRGVCPKGWHLPSGDEWKTLFTAVGETTAVGGSGTMLKSTEGWNDYEGTSGNGSDTYFFSALPAGYRNRNGNFYEEGNVAYFWGSTEENSYSASIMYLDNFNDFMDLSLDYKYFGFSVRCLRD